MIFPSFPWFSMIFVDMKDHLRDHQWWSAEKWWIDGISWLITWCSLLSWLINVNYYQSPWYCIDVGNNDIYIYIILEYHEDRMAYEINHMMLGFVGWVLQFLCSIHPAKILLILLLGQIWCFFAWRPFVAAGSLAPNTPFPSKHYFFYVVSLLNILSYWVIFFHMNNLTIINHH